MQVLSECSFFAEDNQLTHILGANGSGKSTLLKCILGLLKPQSGTIEIDGNNITDFSRRELAHLISYVPQKNTPAFNMEVTDFVLLGVASMLSAFASPGAADILRANKILESLNIADLAGRGIAELSGGEFQMCVIARSLMQDSKTITLDEPTSSLDFGNQLKLHRLLKKLSTDGKSVIVTSHDPGYTLMFADNAVVIKDGQVFAAGCPSDVITEDLIFELYGERIDLNTIVWKEK